jgi:hypothetical protein
MGGAVNTVGTTAANVGRTVLPLGPRMTACYRDGLAQGAPVATKATLHIDTSDDGLITEARVVGPVASGISACIASAVRGRKIANVDTGSASADIPLVFRAE